MAAKLMIVFFILGTVFAKPLEAQDDLKYREEHCIKMTPQKHEEIQSVVEKIAAFLEQLHSDHSDYDIRLVKFDIEGHSDDEIEEKETVLQVTINDCAKLSEEETTENLKTQTANKEENANKNNENEQNGTGNTEKDQISSGNDEIHSENYQTTTRNVRIVSANDQIGSGNDQTSSDDHISSDDRTAETDVTRKSKATFKYLDLSETGQQALDVLGRNRRKPILVILEELNGERRVILPVRK